MRISIKILLNFKIGIYFTTIYIYIYIYSSPPLIVMPLELTQPMTKTATPLGHAITSPDMTPV